MESDDLSTKPCPCGETMAQIIGHDENAKKELVPARRGWYCFNCRHWEDAILRETVVEDY
jgi:hypothetical protein